MYELFTGDIKVLVTAKYQRQQSTSFILRTRILDCFESTGDSKVLVLYWERLSWTTLLRAFPWSEREGIINSRIL